jgi:hypothetical protein
MTRPAVVRERLNGFFPAQLSSLANAERNAELSSGPSATA